MRRPSRWDGLRHGVDGEEEVRGRGNGLNPWDQNSNGTRAPRGQDDCPLVPSSRATTTPIVPEQEFLQLSQGGVAGPVPQQGTAPSGAMDGIVPGAVQKGAQFFTQSLTRANHAVANRAARQSGLRVFLAAARLANVRCPCLDSAHDAADDFVRQRVAVASDFAQEVKHGLPRDPNPCARTGKIKLKLRDRAVAQCSFSAPVGTECSVEVDYAFRDCGAPSRGTAFNRFVEKRAVPGVYPIRFERKRGRLLAKRGFGGLDGAQFCKCHGVLLVGG